MAASSGHCLLHDYLASSQTEIKQVFESELNCRKMTFHLPFSANEFSFFKRFFFSPLCYCQHQEVPTPDEMTRPEQAPRRSVTAMLVQGNVHWLLCVLAPADWLRVSHGPYISNQGRRRRTLAACRRLSPASAGRLALCPPLQCHFSLSVL